MTSNEPVANHNAWRAAVRSLANDYYDLGHSLESRAIEEMGIVKSDELRVRAEHYQQVYSELCALIDRVDPRPGSASGTARPW